MPLARSLLGLLLFAICLVRADAPAPPPVQVTYVLLITQAELITRLQHEDLLAELFTGTGDEEAAVRFRFRGDVYRELLSILPPVTP